MKILIYSIILLAIVLIGYSSTILDFNSLFEGDSSKAVMAIIASLCVIVLMVILLLSRKISKKQNA
ncbi:MAG: hypothetical protein RI572_00750 [Salegentibacter sp.]|uniref:Uncharacterized protein n=1 Tax=Salegentibacter flavus TaxID=287099 RepID=A0A1I5AV84_9FLAO|nr:MULTISPECIES: hypothetical protein [Salegentibacter]MDR9455910.1 hypothetical protein [Salegentibacter sp.]SFN66302.1 hypothetical protein SAMN05660413_02036 [Salegentibacter flavus]